MYHENVTERPISTGNPKYLTRRIEAEAFRSIQQRANKIGLSCSAPYNDDGDDRLYIIRDFGSEKYATANLDDLILWLEGCVVGYILARTKVDENDNNDHHMENTNG